MIPLQQLWQPPASHFTLLLIQCAGLDQRSGSVLRVLRVRCRSKDWRKDWETPASLAAPDRPRSVLKAANFPSPSGTVSVVTSSFAWASLYLAQILGNVHGQPSTQGPGSDVPACVTCARGAGGGAWEREGPWEGGWWTGGAETHCSYAGRAEILEAVGSANEVRGLTHPGQGHRSSRLCEEAEPFGWGLLGHLSVSSTQPGPFRFGASCGPLSQLGPRPDGSGQPQAVAIPIVFLLLILPVSGARRQVLHGPAQLRHSDG